MFRLLCFEMEKKLTLNNNCDSRFCICPTWILPIFTPPRSITNCPKFCKKKGGGGYVLETKDEDKSAPWRRGAPLSDNYPSAVRLFWFCQDSRLKRGVKLSFWEDIWLCERLKACDYYSIIFLEYQKNLLAAFVTTESPSSCVFFY